MALQIGTAMAQKLRAELGHIEPAAQCQMLLFTGYALTKASRRACDPEILRTHATIMYRAALELAPLEAIAPDLDTDAPWDEA